MIYESMFGNTSAVATAIAEGLRQGLLDRGLDVSVELADVAQAP